MHQWFTQTIDPVAIEVFGLPVRWYGLSYIAGFLVGPLILGARTKIDGRYPPEFDAWDFVTCVAIGAILGGRLGEVLFYRTSYYLDHPIEILFLWKGGMSSHGGMIGVLGSTILYAHRRHVDPLIVLDDVSLAALPGLFFGRIANFINSELVGAVSDVCWAVIFPAHDALPRHPVQLYQAVAEGPVLAIILLAALKLNLRPGGRASLFLVFYGALRFLTEQFRETDPGYLGNWHGLTNGQWLSIGMIVIGIACLAIFDISKRFLGSTERQ